MCLSEGIFSIDFNLVKWEFWEEKFVIECKFENDQSDLDKKTGMVKEKKNHVSKWIKFALECLPNDRGHGDLRWLIFLSEANMKKTLLDL